MLLTAKRAGKLVYVVTYKLNATFVFISYNPSGRPQLGCPVEELTDFKLK